MPIFEKLQTEQTPVETRIDLYGAAAGTTVLTSALSPAPNANKYLVVTADGTHNWYGTAGDAQPAFSIGGSANVGIQSWGPGGASVTDVTLRRVGVGAISISSSGPHILALVGSGGGGLGTNGYQARFQGDSGGFGGGLRFESVETGTSTVQPQALIEAEGSGLWNSVATATSFLRFYTATGGTLTEQWRINANGNIQPGADNALNIGSSALRTAAVVSMNFLAYGTASDANPQTSVGLQSLAFGPGGATATDVAMQRQGGGSVSILCSGTEWVNIQNANGALQMRSTGSIGWTNGTPSGGTLDTILVRDAANTLAQRNGVNAQGFNIYNTYTSGTNFERGEIRWGANVLIVGTNFGGGGGSSRNISFEVGGTQYWVINGNLIPNTDNAVNLGSAANRVGNFYASVSFQVLHAVSDANASAQMSDGQFALGVGGATSPDTLLVRDAVATLALKNGTNAQTLRVYGTTTGPVYLKLANDGTNGIINHVSGSGILALQYNGANTITLASSSLVNPGVNGGVALGNSSNIFSAVVANAHQVFHTTADTNASASMGDGQFALGVGGATAVDVIVVRDGAGIWAQKNGANAQTIRVYGTTTGPKYIQATHDGTDGRVLSIAGQLIFGAANAYAWALNGSNNFIAIGGDNVNSIGLSGASRPSNIFAAGFVSCGVQCLTKTAATYTVPTSEQRAEYDNNGSAGQVAFTLPASAVGLVYTFVVLTAQNVRIVGNGAETIRVAGSISTATTGHIDNATVGGVIRLSCHVAGTWIATYQEGVWTVT